MAPNETASMRVTTRMREGNIVTPMRIKPKRNRKRVATAMTSNVPSPVNARLAGSVELGWDFVLGTRDRCRCVNVLHCECLLTAAHFGLSQ